MQKRIPRRRSLCPSTPRKLTADRSGSFKFASPAAASGSAASADCDTNSKEANPAARAASRGTRQFDRREDRSLEPRWSKLKQINESTLTHAIPQTDIWFSSE